MCEHLSFEVETRRHTEPSKVTRVLHEPSIPYLGIPEDILYHVKRMLPNCSPIALLALSEVSPVLLKLISLYFLSLKRAPGIRRSHADVY